MNSLAIVRLAARGDGVAADGRFVAGAAPGDQLLQDGRLEPGPNRATPPCQHFGACGGCQLQHVADPALAAFAADRVLEPLARLGIAPERLMPVHMSPPGSRRRAALRATRTAGQVRLGFNAEGAHSIVDMAECPILHPRLLALIGPLRQLLGPHLREKSAIGVTLTLTDSGVDLLLSNLQANSLPLIEGLSQFARDHHLARLSVSGPLGVEPVVELRAPANSMGGVAVPLPPAPFLQATADGEQALVDAVLAIIGGAPTVVDLFAGAGTFALPASRTARVHAVDGAAPALQALARAARSAGRPVTTDHRDLFRKPLSAQELAPYAAAIIDPPRAGAIAQCQALAEGRVPVVAAVSCNPATFARDAERLVGGGYRLGRLWPVAQFRWSTHIELVAEFRR